ncbi:hypothetical protein HK104_002854, partial [Borealophlyctis nickersoniae]
MSLQTLPSPTTLALSAVATFLLAYGAYAYTTTTTLPKSKFSLPFVGSLFAIWPYLKDQKVMKFIYEEQRRLGPIFTLQFFGSIPVLGNPKEIKRVLTDNRSFYRGDKFQQAAEGVAKYSLFLLPSGDLWHRHRKLLAPAFSPHHIRTLFSTTLARTDALLDHWSTLPHPIDIYDQASRLTLDIIGRVALGGGGGEFDCTKENNDTFQAFGEIIKAIGDRYGMPEVFWGVLGVSRKQIQKSADTARGVAERIVERRARELKSGGERVGDVLDCLLDEGTDGEKLTMEEIVDETLGFILAGHDTTSNALTFTLYELMRNPDVESQLLDEIDTVIGKNGTPQWDDLPKFKYLDYVVK